MVERDIPGKSDTQGLVERRVIRSEEFPPDPEERLAAVLAGFANSEAKAITLLLLKEYLKTPSDIWHEFLETTERHWKLGHSNPKSYCNHSLVPIGMVAEELFLSMGALEWTVGYAVTEAGKHYGQPIAAFLLKKAAEYGYSFHPIFGATQSRSDSRAPFTRTKILETIIHNPASLRTIDIEEFLGLKTGTTSRQLVALHKAGLIHYDSVDTQEPGYAQYQWQPRTSLSKVRPVGSRPTLTFQVAEILIGVKKRVCREEIQAALQERFPGEDPNLSNISEVLNGLLKQGLVISQFQGFKKQSEIELLEKGKQIYQEILLPIKDALADGPTLKKMNSLLSNWSQFAPEAVSLYREASPMARKEPRVVWQKRIFRLVSSHPKGLHSKEVSLAFPNLPQATAGIHLRHLYQQGLLQRQREGTKIRYFPIEKHQNS